MGGVVPDFAEEGLRLHVPEPARPLRQKAGLVVAPLPQPLGADGDPGHRVERTGEAFGGGLGDELPQGPGGTDAAMELEAADGLPDRALIPKRRGAEEAAPQFPEAVGLVRPGEGLFALRAHAGSVQDPAAEGALGREEEVQESIGELHDSSSSS